MACCGLGLGKLRGSLGAPTTPGPRHLGYLGTTHLGRALSRPVRVTVGVGGLAVAVAVGGWDGGGARARGRRRYPKRFGDGICGPQLLLSYATDKMTVLPTSTGFKDFGYFGLAIARRT